MCNEVKVIGKEDQGRPRETGRGAQKHNRVLSSGVFCYSKPGDAVSPDDTL